MLIPFISKWKKRTMIFEALIALEEFQRIHDRKLFKEWEKRWKEELDLIKVTRREK